MNRILMGRSTIVLSILAFTALGLPLAGEQARRPGYLGVAFSVDFETGVLTIERVVPDSPAEAASVRVADQLVSVGGEEARFSSHLDALQFFSEAATPGTPLVVTVVRSGQQRSLRLVPDERPASLHAENVRALRCADGDRASEAAGFPDLFEKVP